jgi:hypothetical protein
MLEVFDDLAREARTAQIRVALQAGLNGIIAKLSQDRVGSAGTVREG